MAEGIRVSVIIPFFNDELYLEDSVRSAMSQNESKIEILCINDGSTDSPLNLYTLKYIQKIKNTAI